METLRRYGVTELRPARWFWFVSGEAKKGLMAAEVYPDLGTLNAAH